MIPLAQMEKSTVRQNELFVSDHAEFYNKVMIIWFYDSTAKPYNSQLLPLELL